MNKENMLKVADYIENAPKEQFHMGAWFGHYVKNNHNSEDTDQWYPQDDDWSDSTDFYMSDIEWHTGDAFSKELNCGTTACIAGWAAVTFYYENKDEYNDFCLNGDDGYSFVEEFAKSYLGLGDEDAQRLFHCNKGSIWYQVKDEYGFEFDPLVNESWDISNKHAADVIKRLANGELKFPTIIEY